jgi:hypothetical protein
MRFDKSESYVVRRFADQMFRRPRGEKKFAKNSLRRRAAKKEKRRS